MDLATVILAAGKGIRMKSDLPKVLHPLNGKPMIHYVIHTARNIGSRRVILVIGHKKELVIEETKKLKVEYVVQHEQLGTGHAVRQCEPYFRNYNGNLLVLSGDVPLLTYHTLNRLIDIQSTQKPLATLLTARLKDPSGYGRIVRDEDGYVQKIVEHKDATPDILKINEINAGIYIFRSQPLFDTIPKLKNENSQGEYYLPDVIKMYVEQGQKVAAVLARQSEETHGINDLDQLRHAENILKRRSMPM